ncbi:hypothetical protein EVAR_42975_1 [Eumeta japonica]|uniref:Uncharacterized protein n=1 Tax=Eumeta variegata TaxID=151549 RepID=A0A4C1ZTE2_EUMVA|nr:hypothetical protein EVAR_42975_1 [Eumeta japonica]
MTANSTAVNTATRATSKVQPGDLPPKFSYVKFETKIPNIIPKDMPLGILGETYHSVFRAVGPQTTYTVHMSSMTANSTAVNTATRATSKLQPGDLPPNIFVRED